MDGRIGNARIQIGEQRTNPRTARQDPGGVARAKRGVRAVERQVSVGIEPDFVERPPKKRKVEIQRDRLRIVVAQMDSLAQIRVEHERGGRERIAARFRNRREFDGQPIQVEGEFLLKEAAARIENGNVAVPRRSRPRRPLPDAGQLRRAGPHLLLPVQQPEGQGIEDIRFPQRFARRRVPGEAQHGGRSDRKRAPFQPLQTHR